MNETVVAYVRDRGPIAYTVGFFGEDALLSQLPERLLQSGLVWYWESSRDAPIAEDADTTPAPPERPLSLLTQDNAGLLRQDSEEWDVEGNGRWILIVGLDASAPRRSLRPAEVNAAFRAFAVEEAGPIRIVIHQIPDCKDALVFVPHHLIDPVERLLRGWGVVPEAISRKRSYRDLRTARLESLPYLRVGDGPRGCLLALLHLE